MNFCSNYPNVFWTRCRIKAFVRMECRLLVSCLVLLACGSLAMLPVLTHVHSKFEYKYSFKGPYLINSRGNIPFWTHGGSCIPSDDQVRVCPSIKSRRGWAWTKEKFAHNHWMVDVSLRVAGRLKTGADGLAIWFTAEQGSEGFAFGNADIWRGLGIILDSFDNNGLHDNPKIQAVLNDGTQRYDHSGDGINQEAGSCLKDFRNRPNPVKLRITFLRGVLEVWVHEGISSVVDDYVLCLRTEETSRIPSEGYFGVSAATGGLSDDHDVLSFIVHSLTPMEEKTQELLKSLNQEEVERVTGQYSSMAEEFDQRRQQYEKEHHDPDMSDWQYEMEMERNVRYIADMQSQLGRELTALHQKIDTLLGSGAVDRRSAEGSVLPDITAIKNTEANILHQISDLKASFDRSVPQGAKVTASEQLQPVYEVRNLVQQNSQRLAAMEKHLKEGPPGHQCPPPSDSSSCVSPFLFLVVIAMQVSVLVGYMVYRQRQEAAAKKFF